MIYHWCPQGDWEAAQVGYTAGSLETEGFIHCSFRDQVERTATGVDRGREGLVLLCIDEGGLPVRAEDCYELGEEYPHVYGPIPTTSVMAVIPFPPNDDGSFSLPEGA